VKQWIDTELLYQEALRMKIDREPAIKDRLEKMKKDLLAAEIMSRNSLQDQSAIIDENAVRAYYELNKEKFVREKDVAKYLEIVVADSRTAWYITRNGNSENFLTLAAEYSQQPYPENINIPYIALEDVQPEISQAISGTMIGGTSNPVKTDLGYHVIHVLDKLEKGGICKEEEIWEDIVNQLSAKTQKENVEQFLSDLRLKTNVDFNSELIKTGNQGQQTEPK
jgi:parvulin-like peptidyl-prolyl isomerase